MTGDDQKNNMERGVPSAPLPSWGSFVECLRDRAAAQPEALALYELEGLRDRRSPLTYCDLDRKVRAVAARLQQEGAEGQRILLVIGNDLNYVIAFLACAYARCIAVNLLPPTKSKHVNRLALVAEDCDATFVLTSGPRSGELRRKLAEAPRLARMTWIRVDEIPDSYAGRYEVKTPVHHDTCYLQYTSGSTGEPRGVMVTHQNLVAQSGYLGKLCQLEATDRCLNWMPLYHDLGLILGILLPLYCGIPAALSDPLSFIKHPDRWLRAISEQQITFASGPNFAFDLCLDSVDPSQLKGVDLSCWKIALNGAEPLRSRTLQRFAETFTHLGWKPTTMHPAYGLAEFTLVVTGKPRGTLPKECVLDAVALSQGTVRIAQEGARCHRAVSSGRPGAETTLRIVDPERCVEVEPGQTGELWVSGPCIARGYWNREEASRKIFQAQLPGDPRSYLRTGDLAFILDGELYITGRLKDVVIVCGANHYPQDIEETVERVDPAIRPNFVTVFSDERGDREALVAVAEIRSEAAAGFGSVAVAERIFRAVAREHEIQLEEIHFVHHGEVPKTTSGKTQRAASRRLLRDGGFQTYASVKRGVAP